MLVAVEKTGKKRMFLRVVNGVIEMKSQSGEVSHFGGIAGKLVKIELKVHEVENKKFQNWHIVLEDGAEGEVYDLAIPRSSGAFRGIIRCLVTPQGMENLDDIKIEIYKSKTGYTNSKVFAGGQKLQWTEEPMPEAKKVMVSGQEVIDDTDQVNWLTSKVNLINSAAAALAHTASEEAVEEYGDDEDMPE